MGTPHSRNKESSGPKRQQCTTENSWFSASDFRAVGGGGDWAKAFLLFCGKTQIQYLYSVLLTADGAGWLWNKRKPLLYQNWLQKICPPFPVSPLSIPTCRKWERDRSPQDMITGWGNSGTEGALVIISSIPLLWSTKPRSCPRWDWISQCSTLLSIICAPFDDISFFLDAPPSPLSNIVAILDHCIYEKTRCNELFHVWMSAAHCVMTSNFIRLFKWGSWGKKNNV